MGWHETWQKTPVWHPRRLMLGQTMRRWVWGAEFGYSWGDGQWEYADEQECARTFLEETYGPDQTTNAIERSA